MALPVNCSTHLIPAYYSFTDPERMKGWVGLVGWPVADGLPKLVVTHQLPVERRTGKVRQSETDVLQLCHATNQIVTTKLFSSLSRPEHVSGTEIGAERGENGEWTGAERWAAGVIGIVVVRGEQVPVRGAAYVCAVRGYSRYIHTYLHTNLYSAKNRENESEALAQNN